jgi:hypothetical protein
MWSIQPAQEVAGAWGAWSYKPNLGDGRFGPLQTPHRDRGLPAPIRLQRAGRPLDRHGLIGIRLTHPKQGSSPDAGT